MNQAMTGINDESGRLEVAVRELQVGGGHAGARWALKATLTVVLRLLLTVE